MRAVYLAVVAVGAPLAVWALAALRRRCAELAAISQAISDIGRQQAPTHREVAAVNLAEHRARAHRSCVRHGLIDPDPENQR